MKNLIYLLAGFLLLSFTNLKAQKRVPLSSYEVAENTANEKTLNFDLNSQDLNFIAQKIVESNINGKEKFNAEVLLKSGKLSITLSKDVDQVELSVYLNYIGVKPSEQVLKLFIEKLAN